MHASLTAVSSAGSQRDLSSTRSGLQYTDGQTRRREFPKLLEGKLHLIKGNLSTVLMQLYRSLRQHSSYL